LLKTGITSSAFSAISKPPMQIETMNSILLLCHANNTAMGLRFAPLPEFGEGLGEG
jgi:hypothetical protein